VRADQGLPAVVEETRAAIARDANERNYDALKAHIPLSGFAYTFGGPTSGGPIAYWRKLETTGTGEHPIDVLARIMELPYSLRQGHYVWPFAYGTPKSELTGYERALLGDLVDSYVGEDYYGWRAGIKPDGTWSFFLSGD
jgi:hypothetical protein